MKYQRIPQHFFLLQNHGSRITFTTLKRQVEMTTVGHDFRTLRLTATMCLKALQLRYFKIFSLMFNQSPHIYPLCHRNRDSFLLHTIPMHCCSWLSFILIASILRASLILDKKCNQSTDSCQLLLFCQALQHQHLKEKIVTIPENLSRLEADLLFICYLGS